VPVILCFGIAILAIAVSLKYLMA